MVPLVGNIGTNLITNGTTGKEIVANGNAIGTIERTPNTCKIWEHLLLSQNNTIHDDKFLMQATNMAILFTVHVHAL